MSHTVHHIKTWHPSIDFCFFCFLFFFFLWPGIGDILRGPGMFCTISFTFKICFCDPLKMLLTRSVTSSHILSRCTVLKCFSCKIVWRVLYIIQVVQAAASSSCLVLVFSVFVFNSHNFCCLGNANPLHCSYRSIKFQSNSIIATDSVCKMQSWQVYLLFQC